MILGDGKIANLVFHIPAEDRFFDLWCDDHWIGMATGVDEASARAQAVESLGVDRMSTAILTPFMGCGKSQETYKTQTGRDCYN